MPDIVEILAKNTALNKPELVQGDRAELVLHQ